MKPSFKITTRGITLADKTKIKLHYAYQKPGNYYVSGAQTNAEPLIVAYSNDYFPQFPAEIVEALQANVKCDTDTSSDYFDHARLIIPHTSPLFAQLAQVIAKRDANTQARLAKKDAKHAAKKVPCSETM
jgi:hypothetical protein